MPCDQQSCIFIAIRNQWTNIPPWVTKSMGMNHFWFVTTHMLCNNCTSTGVVCTHTLHRYGVGGYGCGFEPSNPSCTCAEPYSCLFRWDARSCSKWSMLISVMILKRCEWHMRVQVTAWFSSSYKGILSKGSEIWVSAADREKGMACIILRWIIWIFL